MQTFSIPYTCPDEDRAAIREMRRIQSAAVRSAYANALGADGKFRSEKEIRALVKSRFAGGRIDAWSLHCATRQGISMRHLTPDGSAVFGGKKELERRRKRLISREDWREARLLPLYAIGDKTVLGNRHIRLDRDAAGATLRMYKARIRLDLTGMRGSENQSGEDWLSPPAPGPAAWVRSPEAGDGHRVCGRAPRGPLQAGALAPSGNGTGRK